MLTFSKLGQYVWPTVEDCVKNADSGVEWRMQLRILFIAAVVHPLHLDVVGVEQANVQIVPSSRSRQIVRASEFGHRLHKPLVFVSTKTEASGVYERGRDAQDVIDCTQKLQVDLGQQVGVHAEINIFKRFAVRFEKRCLGIVLF